MTDDDRDSYIAELKKQLARDDLGTECERYTRIVGYFRNINNFNIGKSQEYKERKEFKIEKT